MNIQEDYISFETAKLIKPLDFIPHRQVYVDRTEEGVKKFGAINHPFMGQVGITLHDNNVDTYYPKPTQALVLKWLRVKYNIHIDTFPIGVETSDKQGYRYGWGILELKEGLEKAKGYEYTEPLGYYSYEQSTEAAIFYCLTNLIK